jgi:hypothetical protein
LDKPQPATTPFARSRLLRSLLNAHSAVTGCWCFVSVIHIDKVQDLTHLVIVKFRYLKQIAAIQEVIF